MTVTANDTIERYTINGVGPYAFSFRIFAKSDIVATVIDTTNTALVLDTDFTINDLDVNDPDGGEITLDEDFADNYDGLMLDIRSSTPVTQPSALNNQGSYSARAIEQMFDRLSRQIQDVNRLLTLCVRMPDTDLAQDALGVAALRVGKVLHFDSSGDVELSSVLDATVATGNFARTDTGNAFTNATQTIQGNLILHQGTLPASSGTFTGTLTGMGGATTGSVSYILVGKVCTLFIDANITGTSNSTSMQMTGLPAAVIPAVLRTGLVVFGINNGTPVYVAHSVSAAGVITFSPEVGGVLTTWTASGTKGLQQGWCITYPLSL